MPGDRPRAHWNTPLQSISTDGGRPPLDRVLEALSREFDRYVLYYLVENEPVAFDELVDAVIELQTDGSPTAVSDEVRRKVRIQLYHHRLPKLEDLGIVEHDQRNGYVRYRDPPPYFDEFLQLARKIDD